MICAGCNQLILNGGVICIGCNSPRDDDAPPKLSYHALALTVRRLKGLVLASLFFGILVAPLTIWIATKALRRFGNVPTADPAELRQIVLLRRLAIALLLFWALYLGAELADLMRAS
ncbi:MAG TPA: hypothetical protein VGF28_16460 [Thermoanaerobaculia bacterium]|jgi:hypothetical protein